MVNAETGEYIDSTVAEMATINSYRLLFIWLLMMSVLRLSSQESYADKWLPNKQSDEDHDEYDSESRTFSEAMDLSIENYPNYVAITRTQNGDTQMVCFGVIIDISEFVLAPASCFDGDEARKPDNWNILYGLQWEPHVGKTMAIVNISVHPDYNKDTRKADIALLQIKRKLKSEEYVTGLPNYNWGYPSAPLFVIPNKEIDFYYADSDIVLDTLGFGWLPDINWGQFISARASLYKDGCEKVISPFDKEYQLCSLLQKEKAVCAAMPGKVDLRPCSDEVYQGTVVIAKNWEGGPNSAVIGMKGLYPQNCKQNNFIDEQIVVFTSIGAVSPWIRQMME